MCLILYGSATGNAADLADVLYDRLRRRKLHSVVCKPFGEARIEELRHHRHVFVICATTGQGQLPPNAQPFWGNLLRRSVPRDSLQGVQLYAFGLGSSAYPKYQWAIRKIHARLLQLGVEEAVPRGEGNDLGDEPYEYVFDQWMALALSNFDSDLQITDVLETNALLPPLKSSLEEQIGSLSLGENATILENRRITSADHFQDVRHIIIKPDLPLKYDPGDVVKLYPSNDEATVDAIMVAQQWPARWKSFLMQKVDLNAIPRRAFFAIAQHFCSKPTQSERMREFTEDLDDLFNYTSRPRRSIAEVVLEFDSLRIPTEYICDIFPPLRPRQFSIASPPGENIELCVAIVKYRTVLRRIRRGLCTRWLDQCCTEGTRIRISLESNKMELEKRAENRPIIAVATGTGIAPIRSWLKGTQLAPWLFFGCRNEKDFLYADEFGNARVVTAFSQSTGPKTYVQAAILQHAKELPIKDALIFVCGSSGPMPTAVRASFIQSLTEQGYADAEEIIRNKEKAGLYFQETW